MCNNKNVSSSSGFELSDKIGQKRMGDEQFMLTRKSHLEAPWILKATCLHSPRILNIVDGYGKH